jgi:hypothetical protein
MQRPYLLLIFIVAHFSTYCQINDSFSDNDFSNNPVWTGETSYFIVNPSFQLQSNGPNASSKLHLSTPNSRCRDTEWDFYTNLDFDITTSNYALFYLTSDREDTENYPKGYYVKFDGTTNAVDLFKQDSLTHTKIIAGKSGRAAKASLNIFQVKVFCDTKGNWFLFSDSTGTGNNFVKEGTVLDTTFSTSSYFGVYFAHSSTRRQKFHFDDFSIQQAPLSLLFAKATSSASIDLHFSKNLEKNSAENITNYFLQPNNITISTASLDSINKSVVHLLISGNLNTYTNYTLSANNIFDENLNPISFLNNASFFYRVETDYGDLIISELFPDPSPQNGLPEYEFIELFNRKNDTLELKNFVLSDGTTNAIFPSYKLPPHQYLIVCNNSNVTQFSSYQPVLGLPAFPSLNNSDDDLTLKNETGKLLHEVNYIDSWYGDNDKKTGGWSLEIIDVNNPCGEESNWTASVHPSGGTPGQINSVFASKPDLESPRLLNAFIIDSAHIQLIFDEKPDKNFISVSQFNLNKGYTITNSFLYSASRMIIVLETFQNFKAGEFYLLSFSGIRDCNGNILTLQHSIKLVLPQKAHAGDIIINELLFNPRVGGYDFVELYNASDKYIDLKNWQLANLEEGIISNKKIISSIPLILKPKEYIAFTEYKSILLNQYPLGNSSATLQIKDLPSFNDDEGAVILLDSNDRVFEQFDYSEDLHYALIDDKEGVSLERISFTESANNNQNWQSASTQSGYATPGYKNSQHFENTNEAQVWIEPKIFTPDQNGDKDFALINYKFDTSGNTVNIIIFDRYGREIIRLAQNELLATEGFYKWEGNNTNNEKVRSGVYVVYFECFDLKGNVRKYKETVVVGWSE